MDRILVVGAGFSGAVIARQLAEAGLKILVVEERKHIAGNCYTYRDQNSGIMIHKYGPHIFHTDSQRVWDYVGKFAKFMPFINRVKATAGGKVYSFPVNLHTINQLFDATMSPAEAESFIKSRCVTALPIRSFRDQAMALVGPEIYEAFFEGYTRKQWGVEPELLPASILKRLPLRFTYDDNYFSHEFQGIPCSGYTELIGNLLNHHNIELKTSQKFENVQGGYSHTFYSGALDRYFGYKFGRLAYRTLEFEEIRSKGSYQGVAVMNYPDQKVPYTRITEHKFFAPWEMGNFKETVAFAEYSSACGIDDDPYYPVRLISDMKVLEGYEALAERESGTTFVGRLGTYAYLDMDVTVDRALTTAAQFLGDIHD
jgi:UDP-galactopyranose mutase